MHDLLTFILFYFSVNFKFSIINSKKENCWKECTLYSKCYLDNNNLTKVCEYWKKLQAAALEAVLISSSNVLIHFL